MCVTLFQTFLSHFIRFYLTQKCILATVTACRSHSKDIPAIFVLQYGITAFWTGDTALDNGQHHCKHQLQGTVRIEHR